MAKPKMTFKTPLCPLSWVNVRGKGKLKKDMDPNSEDPADYNYTATVTLTKAQADVINTKLKKFWADNKPQGVGKQKYDLVKEEFVKVIGKDGKPVLDDEDEPVKEATGNYTMQAKTMTEWPDGKANYIKLMGSNGEILPDGHLLEGGCGAGTEGIIHGSIGINAFGGNEGLMFFLNGVQVKDSSYKEYTGGDTMEVEGIDDEGVADTTVPEQAEGKMPEV